MSKTIDNIKCGNYEVVDNQGVSVTRHFTQCLEKELADMEAKLAEKDKEIEKLNLMIKTLSNHDLEMEKEIRHQVCNEIREKAEVFGTGVTGILGYMITIPLLNQIEKGE